jgi:hypothetical protein
VVLFDRSNSTDKNGSRLGIERAIWPATFFPNLGGTYSLNVMPIGFSSNTETWCDWPTVQPDQLEYSQTTKCERLINQLIDRPLPKGSQTHFDAALKAANEQLASPVSGRKFVLLVTDGYFAKGDGRIKCTDGTSLAPCLALDKELSSLNSRGITFCSIFVRTDGSLEKEPNDTLEWLRRQQNTNFSNNTGNQSACPASTEIDLSTNPWKLAEDIVRWYADDLIGLHVRTSDTDLSGRSRSPITVPNGAAQIGLIGLREAGGPPPEFTSESCSFRAGFRFESFSAQAVDSNPLEGERCPGATISGSNLAPSANSLIAVFAPESQVLAACVPNPDGGGELRLRSGFDQLLAFNPRAVWVGEKGEVHDPNLSLDQYQAGSILLNESQASDLQSREGWRIAFNYDTSVNPPGRGEPYELLYQATVFRSDSATPFAARWPISPTIEGEPCVKLFERNLWQKYWLLFFATGALMALLLTRAAYKSQTVDLSGELLVLDSTGTRPITRHTLSGGSPNWFSVGEKLRIESGKSKDGGNWRLVWKKGAALVLQQEAGSTEDWSIGAPKREKGSAVIEFRRVPLSGTSEVQTVRYTPDGGKVEAALERVLDEEAT